MTQIDDAGTDNLKRSPKSDHGILSKLSHWIIAALAIGLLGLGLVAANIDIDRDLRRFLMGIHKEVGVLVFVFGISRIGWRVLRPFPPPVAKLSKFQKNLATVTHWCLLICITVLPITGVLGTVSGDRSVDVFGLFVIPSIGEIGWIETVADNTHWVLSYILILLLTLHAGAALKHHFIDRDSTLDRMLFSVRSSKKH